MVSQSTQRQKMAKNQEPEGPKGPCRGLKEFNIEVHDVLLTQLTKSGLCLYHRGYQTGVNRSKVMAKHFEMRDDHPQGEES